jgi:ligand-binding sensor domain-containing protein/serine phosphatase RsbU (regulator of sigma subunit)
MMNRIGAGALAAGAVCVLAAAPARAQGEPTAPARPDVEVVTIAPQPVTLQRMLRFQVLGRNDGLPENTVKTVAQDKTGFIWLGTEDGLARWDGRRFLTFRYDDKNPTSLSSSFVNRVLVAKDGTLWVGTEGGGVNRYRPDTGSFDRFMATGKPDALADNMVRALAEGPDGRIWIGTLNGGLGALDPASGKIRSYSREDGLNPTVLSVVADADGALWVGTAEGLFRLDSKAGTAELQLSDHEELASATISALYRDKDDLWIGTEEVGLHRYSLASKKVTSYAAKADDLTHLADPAIRSIFRDRSDRMWVATGSALHLMDDKAGTFERFVPSSSDPSSLPALPLDIFQDNAGVLWVTTFAGGVGLLDLRGFAIRSYNTAGSLSGFFLDGKDLWVTSWEGVCRVRGEGTMTGVCYKTGNSIPVLVDRQGTVWVGTLDGGLLRLDKGEKDRWTKYSHDPEVAGSIAPGVCTSLYEDHEGHLWVGLIGGGLQQYDRARNQFTTPFDIGSTDVYAIKGDPKDPGITWVGTQDKGLLSVGKGSVTTFTPSRNETESHGDNSVVDFDFQGEDTIWVATYGGGLKSLERKAATWTSYRRAQGLPSDNVYAVRLDQTGMLWVSTSSGLVRFDPKTASRQIFSKADGLQSDEFVQAAAVRRDDGLLYFGSLNGFNIFKPEEVLPDAYKPPLVVTSVHILGEAQPGGPALRELDVAHDEGYIDVAFAALSFSGSDQTVFEYQLSAVGDRWLRSDAAVVNLAGLADGTHTIRMRARNRHGVESDPISMTIVVRPPPWRTWYAFAGYGVVLLGIMFGVYRYQKERIDRLKKLARLATVEREFEVTAAVQSWFLPERVRYTNGICDLVGFYRGAEKCSGDWWWYEDLGQGRMWVIVADVTGHGAGPAMLTAAVAMGLSVQADETGDDVIRRLERVNREVLLRCKGKATMTMTALVIDQNTGDFMVYGLGGIPVLLMSADGRHQVIGASGTPLGSIDQLVIGQRAARMGPGDRLVVTTDGIIETVMNGGRQLGIRRFVNIVRDTRQDALELAVARIVRDVDNGRTNAPQEDDFTFCVLERRG